MSQYPEEYTQPQYAYYPTQYQVMQWQSIFTVLVGVAVLVAMGAWAFSLVRKAFKGEEVKFPL
jgi:uncharacterized membrane protein